MEAFCRTVRASTFPPHSVPPPQDVAVAPSLGRGRYRARQVYLEPVRTSSRIRAPQRTGE